MIIKKKIIFLSKLNIGIEYLIEINIIKQT